MGVEDSEQNQQLSFSIINTTMTVEAMRDSGYKSTAHALAELIDNSIEAGATTIELFGVEKRMMRSQRTTSRLEQLAVLDNGCGMSRDELRGSLRYGHGTRRRRRGIGRFGVGLPNSSMSQASRVDIWSWQAGVTNALHTSLSIQDVEEGMTEIPEPQHRELPEIYRQHSLYGFEDSGTLVVWTELDRVEWRRAASTFRHTEILIGRIYRRFLADPRDRLSPKDDRGEEIGPQRKIICIPVQLADNGSDSTVDEEIISVRPNDPLYLMSNTSCPESFGAGPMFEELLIGQIAVPVVLSDGSSHDVLIRGSYAKPHVRDSSHTEANWPSNFAGGDAGHTPWGKHAANNLGVSVMRAHREIEIDQEWVNNYDPTERWWKVEVDFPPALDEIFGVTNNKQGAMTFQRLAHFNWERERLEGEETSLDVQQRMEADGDPRVHLLGLHSQVQKAIDQVRKKAKLHKQKRGSRHGQDQADHAAVLATGEIERRQSEGLVGDSDRKEQSTSPEDKQRTEVQSLVNLGINEDEATRLVVETLEAGNKVRWIQADQDSQSFFNVESLPGVIQVVLNSSHPVSRDLYDVIHPDADDISPEEARDRLIRSSAAFRLLLYSWARYEEEQSEGIKRQIRKTRHAWGQYAEDFFTIEDEPPAYIDRV